MPGKTDICGILKEAKTIAVVGISDKPFRTSRSIAEYLVDNGYTVFGVNPTVKSTGRIRLFANLKEIPYSVDIVNVFRRSEYIPDIIDDVIAVKPKVLWLQQGIVHNESAKKAEEAGITVIQDECIKVHHHYCL